MTETNNLQTIQDALTKMVGRTIANAYVVERDEDDAYSIVLTLETAEGDTLVLRTQDAEGYSSWLVFSP